MFEPHQLNNSIKKYRGSFVHVCTFHMIIGVAFPCVSEALNLVHLNSTNQLAAVFYWLQCPL